MERWNDRGAAIIPYGNSIILMRRERGYGKNKQIYYTIPGGGREVGEKIDETTIREMKEELGIDVEIVELLYKLDTVRRMQYIFLGKYVSGKLGTGEGEEFQNLDYNKYGKYIPEVVTLEKLKKIKVVPLNLKRELIREFDYIIGKTDKRLKKTKRIETTYSKVNRKNAKKLEKPEKIDKIDKEVKENKKDLNNIENVKMIDNSKDKKVKKAVNNIKNINNVKNGKIVKNRKNIKTTKNIKSSKNKTKNKLTKNIKVELEIIKSKKNNATGYKKIKPKSNRIINKRNIKK